ncbi:MAG: AMP-binding protein [Rhizobiaceae bacterium]|nr:AMP-binding protein [Rhizobiaceae bacterium]
MSEDTEASDSDDGEIFHRLLARRASLTPDKPLLLLGDASLTYRDVELQSNRYAHGLARQGVTKGNRVLVMIPSGVDHILLWLALCKLGALMVPVNDAYMGNLLRHQANDSGAKLAIVWSHHLERWQALSGELPSLKSIAVYPEITDQTSADAPWELVATSSLYSDDDKPLTTTVSASDPMAIFYTSGTTGPSKGVLYSYRQAYVTAQVPAEWIDENDVFYMTLPMFHVGLSQMVGLVLIAGATMAIREKFSVSFFWDDVRRYGATATILLSTMPNFLLSAPAGATDRDHSLRKAIVIPLPANLEGFKQRFGVEVYTFYNMTEVSVPLRSDHQRLANGTSCGRPRPGVDARIVDALDEPVPAGSSGELVLRSDRAWEFSLGYWRNSEKTAESRTNLWFHTGDVFRCDEEGNFYFVDRLKDAIRRRGENISSYEVEAEIETHPAVLESAAVAVPSDDGEDEIKAIIALRDGVSLTAEDLYGYLSNRLPKYMLPLFIEIHESELPKTPTGKILKQQLRSAGTATASRMRG